MIVILTDGSRQYAALHKPQFSIAPSLGGVLI